MSKLSPYETRLDKLSTSNINIIDTQMKEHEQILNTKIDKNIDDLKAFAYSSINLTFFPQSSHNSSSLSNQTSADITKWPLLKSPDFHSHVYQFTKHISPMNLDGNTLLQLKKWRDAIFSDFQKFLSTNNIWLSYKNLDSEHYDITKIFLPPENHSEYFTGKENYEALSRALIVHLVKYTTISS